MKPGRKHSKWNKHTHFDSYEHSTLRFKRNILCSVIYTHKSFTSEFYLSLSLLFLSLSAKRTSLPRPPFPTSPVVNAHWRSPVRPTSVRIHRTFLRVLGKYTAGQVIGLDMCFQKHGSNTDFSPVSLISPLLALTLWALLCLCVLYFGEVSSLLIPVWMFIADYFF